MWIADALMKLGISIDDGAAKLGTFSGAIPLQWPSGQVGSVLYRLPRDPGQRASLFASNQSVIVNEGEVAIVLENGTSHGSLPPGKYVFPKARVVGALDIVWFKTGQQTLRWGIGNVASADQIQVSSNGTLFVRVMDAETFNREVVQGAIVFSEVDLQRFLLPRLQGVLRTVMTRFAALELQQQRDVFANAVRQHVADALTRLGLAIVDLEVVEIGLPAEFKAAISEATLVSHTGKAAVLQASVAAQVKQLEAQALAQAALVQGQAQLQLMAQMQTQGIDPLRMKALEALQSFAEHPAEGVVTDPRAGLFGTVAMAALSGGQQAPAALAPALMASAPVPAAAPAAPVAPPAAGVPASAPAPAATDPSVDLERQLDALVERLAEGKISEETYKKLSERLEAKIAAGKTG